MNNKNSRGKGRTKKKGKELNLYPLVYSVNLFIKTNTCRKSVSYLL